MVDWQHSWRHAGNSGLQRESVFFCLVGGLQKASWKRSIYEIVAMFSKSTEMEDNQNAA
jgi:hypothetical protein